MLSEIRNQKKSVPEVVASNFFLTISELFRFEEVSDSPGRSTDISGAFGPPVAECLAGGLRSTSHRGQGGLAGAAFRASSGGGPLGDGP